MSGDSQLKRRAVVLDLTARRHLEAGIFELFKSCMTDWCGYELSVALTAKAAGRSPSYVRSVLERQKASSWMYASAQGLG